MKAITLIQPGETDQLKIKDIAVPVIEKNEVLIEVKAIGINPIDIKTRAGKGLYPLLQNNDPLILGWDVSGIVCQSHSASFAVGDEVFGMVNFPGHGKTYAEFVAAPAAHLALKPAKTSHEEAAAIPLAALTAYQALVHVGKISAGQKVLIHAAAGGVGHFALQLAKAMGSYVVGTSSDKNRAFVLGYGADEHIDYHTHQLEEFSGKFDLILDTVGGETIDRSMQVLKKGGTIISIPSGLNESVAEKAAAIGAHGYTFRVNSNGEDMKVIADLLEKDAIKVHLSATYSMEEMAQAHQQISTGRTIGKIVVVI